MPSIVRPQQGPRTQPLKCAIEVNVSQMPLTVWPTVTARSAQWMFSRLNVRLHLWSGLMVTIKVYRAVLPPTDLESGTGIFFLSLFYVIIFCIVNILSDK